jgi:hypothetical protein
MKRKKVGMIVRAEDALARARPALFMRTFLDDLESRGDEVIKRLFDIATDEATADKDALKAINMILSISNAEDVIAVAMGLKKKVGRPGHEGEAEAAEQTEAWADAIDLEETEPGKFEQVEE